jgi:polysaccharide export outer membrane protein
MLMKTAMAICVASAAVVLSPSVAIGAQPGWLEDLGETPETVAPVTTGAGAGESEPGTREPSRWPGDAGPVLEQWVITENGVETIDERNARREAEATRSAGATTSEPFEAGEPVDVRYSVQPGDVLQISVWREPELQREVAVSPDGRINYPLIGSVVVEDKTVEQIGAEMEEALGRFMTQAAVTVAVKEPLGNRIYVIGQVNRPGVFPFTKSLDVMQALSLAGGTGKFAELDDIKILRRVDGVQKTFAFDYSNVQRGRNLEQNILLQSGDVILVP